MHIKLTGKTALITGGSHGIGLAIKKALKKEGAKVISWSRSEGTDLTTYLPPLPKVDILINNVGGMGTCGLEDARDCMDKNYGVMLDLTEEFVHRKRKWGRVITISSIHGKEKGPNPYFAAAKAAQIAYMKSRAGTVLGTTFNTICPGHIDVGKPFKELAGVIGKPDDIAGMVVFLCSEQARHIDGAVITVDGGESHSF